MFPQPFDVEKTTLHSRLQDLDRELDAMMLAKAAEQYQSKQPVMNQMRAAIGRMMVRIGERLADTSLDASNCAEEVSF